MPAGSPSDWDRRRECSREQSAVIPQLLTGTSLEGLIRGRALFRSPPRLAPTKLRSNIDCMRTVSRSVLAAILAACFTLSAFTWGSMPGCVQQAGTSAAHAAHVHNAQGMHSTGSPASNHCTVHLCCIQLSGTPSEPGSAGQLTSAQQGTGPTATGFVLLRPSHTLPFAQGPPHSPA